jgi:hypothetical protein
MGVLVIRYARTPTVRRFFKGEYMGVNPSPPPVGRKPMSKIVSYIDGKEHDLEEVWDTISKIEPDIDIRFERLNFLFHDDPKIKSKLDALAKLLVKKYPDRYSYVEDPKEKAVDEVSKKYASTKSRKPPHRQESSEKLKALKLYVVFALMMMLLLSGAFLFGYQIMVGSSMESIPPSITEQSTESGKSL